MPRLTITILTIFAFASSTMAQTAPTPTVIVNPPPANTVSTPIGNVPADALQIWNIGAVGLTIFSLIQLAGETESAGGSF
jgi:hypothetical protein